MLVVCLVIQAVSKMAIPEISLTENELSDQGALLVVRQAGPVDVVLVNPNDLYFGGSTNPPKYDRFQSKQGSFGFQVYIYTYISKILTAVAFYYRWCEC